jgi:putative GTP pyrophosphokinase
MGIINWKEELLPYEQAVDEITTKLKSLKREFIVSGKHSPIEQVDGRVKSIASIIEKADKRRIPVEKVFDTLEDIAGIRVICKFVEDITKVVELIRLRASYDMKIIQEEDYVTNTKKSGYRSYHLTVSYPIVTSTGKHELKCEIQIRTLAMNFWATIEHSLRYKYDGNVPAELQLRLQNCAEAAFQLDNEMTTIRDEMMQVQRTIQARDYIVNEIVNNIHNLYFHAGVENMNRFNLRFTELCQEGNVEKLSDFNKELETMAEIYKVKYV